MHTQSGGAQAGMIEDILQARYLQKSERGYDDICHRVAEAIGNTVVERERFYRMMVQSDFLPNSPCLMNAGTENGQLSACFVLPISDNLEGIFETLKTAALVHKSGGGTGFSFGHLRARGSALNSSGGIASGPVSFMKVFDAATGVVRQGGRRRGANMGILRIRHPDIREFIRSKNVEGELRNFNISVMVDDAFMENPDEELIDLIAAGIWQNGEPGVIFYDRINEANTVPHLGFIEATNPCGEQPLLPYESCTLGSLNLSRYVGGSGIDWGRLEDDTRAATRFLDNVIDKNCYPVRKIADMTKKTRKIGLGVMGFHDLLLKLGVPYDSTSALSLAGEIFGLINDRAVDESRIMASESGPFPEWEQSTWEFPVRNAAMTCIAPTGSISLIAGCSSGIEPVFSWAYRRCGTVGGVFMCVHPFFKEKLVGLGMNEDETASVINHAYTHGTIQDCDILPDSFRTLFKSALDMSPVVHIDMQAEFQKHCHAAISKTINLPEDARVDDVKAAITYAWKKGVKGVTFYRTGSRSLEVLALKKRREKMRSFGTGTRRRDECTHYWCQQVCENCD